MKKKLLEFSLIIAVMCGGLLTAWHFTPTPVLKKDGTEETRTLNDYLNEGRAPGDIYGSNER